jgi:hypothetical protein
MKVALKKDNGNNRLYEKGRSTKGYLRGERIESMTQLAKGDILFNVNHKLQTESLIEVLDVRFNGFDFVFVTAHETVKKGLHLVVKKGDSQPKCKLTSDLPLNECYKAITTTAGMKLVA